MSVVYKSVVWSLIMAELKQLNSMNMLRSEWEGHDHMQNANSWARCDR